MFVDLHTHSQYSPDSNCAIYDMALSQKEKGTSVFAVTDHFDYPNRCDEESVKEIINSVSDARNTKVEGVEILAGVEISRGNSCPETVKHLIDVCDFDVIIGSVHGVELNGVFLRPSITDFSVFNKEETEIIIDNYFDYL